MWNITGQERAIALLESSLKRGRLSHAYLFLGPEGVGKKTLALELAKAVNCLQPEPPCGKCTSCIRISSGRHADVISYNLSPQSEEVADSSQSEESATSSRREIGVDKIRELQEMAHLSPFEGKKKVFIIEEADRLSEEASNRLLKILEEPPPAVLIILLAQAIGSPHGKQTSTGGLLPTIVSRCQIIELHPVSFSMLERTLISDQGLEPGRARHIARVSQGRMGLALKYQQHPEMLKKREEKLMSLIPLTHAEIEARFSFVMKMTEGGKKEWEEILDTLSLWLTWWRDLFLWKSGAKEYVVNLEQEAFINRQAMKLEKEQIAHALFYLHQAKSQLEARANIKLVLEDLMLHLPVVPS